MGYWEIGGAGSTIPPLSEWNAKYLYDPDIHADYKSGYFVVKAGDLSFSVIVFTVCACSCICILYARRVFVGAELGGPVTLKYGTSAALVCLWLLYISLSSWRAMS